MQSVAFDYMYRDASNYKYNLNYTLRFHAEGVSDKELKELEVRIKDACEDGCRFIAANLDIETARVTADCSVDHCYDEFIELRQSELSPNEERHIRDFVDTFESCKNDWKEYNIFSPLISPDIILDALKCIKSGQFEQAAHILEAALEDL